MPAPRKHLFTGRSLSDRMAAIEAITDPVEQQQAIDRLKAASEKPASPEFIREVVEEFYDMLLTDRVEHYRKAIMPSYYPEPVLTEAIWRLLKPGTDWPSVPLVIATCEAVRRDSKTGGHP